MKTLNKALRITTLSLILILSFNSNAENSFSEQLVWESCDFYLENFEVQGEEVFGDNEEIDFFIETDSIVKCDYDSFRVKEITMSKSDYLAFADTFQVSREINSILLKRYHFLRFLKKNKIPHTELANGDIYWVEKERNLGVTIMYEGQDLIGSNYKNLLVYKKGMDRLIEIFKTEFATAKLNVETDDFYYDVKSYKLSNHGCTVTFDLKKRSFMPGMRGFLKELSINFKNSFQGKRAYLGNSKVVKILGGGISATLNRDTEYDVSNIMFKSQTNRNEVIRLFSSIQSQCQ